MLADAVAIIGTMVRSFHPNFLFTLLTVQFFRIWYSVRLIGRITHSIRAICMPPIHFFKFGDIRSLSPPMPTPRHTPRGTWQRYLQISRRTRLPDTACDIIRYEIHFQARLMRNTNFTSKSSASGMAITSDLPRGHSLIFCYVGSDLISFGWP